MVSALKVKKRYLHVLPLYLALSVVAIAFFFPFFWMLMSSFKSPAELLRLPIVWIPSHFLLSNYPAVFKYVPFTRGLLNSALVTLTSVFGATLISSMAAYALAKYRFAGRGAFLNVILISLSVPGFVTLIPLYDLVYRFGWINSYLALIIPYLGSAYSIFLLRQYIITIPDSLIEAARLDGANEFRIFWRVVFPLMRPALAVVIFWNFFNIWNDFLWPLLVINDPKLYTVQLVLSQLQGYESGVSFVGILMAGSFMAILPTLTIYLLGQSQMKRFYNLGGVKG